MLEELKKKLFISRERNEELLSTAIKISSETDELIKMFNKEVKK